MTPTVKTSREATANKRRGGKYLTFTLNREVYGMEILKVREIIVLMDIVPVPCAPEAILGVINLRGKIIPVMDVKKRFGMQEVERSRENCIIVVDLGSREMGIVVDSVSEVMDFPDHEIDPPPEYGVEVQTDFILGMGKIGGRVTILLDIGSVLTKEEVAALPQVENNLSQAGQVVKTGADAAPTPEAPGRSE